MLSNEILLYKVKAYNISKVSNAPSQIWLDRSRDHQPCIFKMLVARLRIGDRFLSSTSSFIHTFIRQILH